MLVLVRKCDESIVIGGDIVVTILGVDGDRIKLGINAPREISILRQELCDEVVSQNRAAVESSSGIRRILPTVKDKLTIAKASEA
ncbi:MAG: carbon storage regulator CsrA [Bacteroidetes bacterium]|nr:carbon storage regulator CsrA [Bacteroidota bacterium]MCL5027280.1 carbon storage regulator CsrA [Chloroflexota bacterium]